ncbi:lectin-24A [Carabus blaptoides fortunei]
MLTDTTENKNIQILSIQRRVGDNKHVQGFSLHSLGDGEPKGVFTSSAAIANCMKSSTKGQLDESSSNSHVMYNWTLPLEQPTRSNITFRLRYKIQASSSVFQVNYAFAISQGCQIWLRRDAANISSIDFPRTLECQVYFPGHRNGDGLVLELTRLNVPCSGGGFLQFSGTGNNSQYHRQAVLCGKLEELADNDRQLYFPDLRNHAPLLHLYGHPVFSLHYHLVDHCYNVTFVTRNGSFELRPTVLKLEIGDESVPASATSPSVVATEEPALACQQDGLFTELWDGSTSWTHCARRGDLYRRTEIVSRDNRVLMKVSARGYHRQPYALVLRFQYYAESVPSIVQQCSFGWVAVRQFCVTAVENVRLPWLQAELECNRRGGHLASIRTEQAQSIIDQLLMNSAGYRDQNAYWLGASDKTYEGDFRWTDGLPFSYTNWFPGWSQYDHYNRQPNDDGLSDQDCIEVRRLYHLPTASVRLSSSFMWNDRDCTTANYFLCERLVADNPMEDGWPPECNRTVTLSREQQRASVSSPGFPRQYPDNADCETEISAPAGYRIVMDFEELVLEKEPLCSYDYLEIIEMALDDHSENVSRRLCGDWSAKLKLLRYVSIGSRLRLRFVSDYSHHYGGFKARMSMENGKL